MTNAQFHKTKRRADPNLCFSPDSAYGTHSRTLSSLEPDSRVQRRNGAQPRVPLSRLVSSVSSPLLSLHLPVSFRSRAIHPLSPVQAASLQSSHASCTTTLKTHATTITSAPTAHSPLSAASCAPPSAHLFSRALLSALARAHTAPPRDHTRPTSGDYPVVASLRSPPPTQYTYITSARSVVFGCCGRNQPSDAATLMPRDVWTMLARQQTSRRPVNTCSCMVHGIAMRDAVR